MSEVDVDLDQLDLMAPEVQEDWFPYYRKLRDEAPVWRVPASGEFFVSRYEDVHYVLRHPELFPHTSTSSDFRLLETDAAVSYYEEHGWRRKQSLGTDPPIHREYRVLVDPWFNGAGAERARPTIERIARSLMDEWIDDGEVEIVSQFAMPLPVLVITSVLGFPARGRRGPEAVVGGVGPAVRPGPDARAGAVRGRAGRRVPALHLVAPRGEAPATRATTCCRTWPTPGSRTPSTASGR